MKRHFLAMLALVACVMGALAQSFPTVSTAEKTVWYLIQFVNGGNAITGDAEGDATTSGAVASPAQLWKVTGDASGYRLTNKKGYTLCVASAAKNQMVQAKQTATGVSKFKIEAISGGYELRPVDNAGISMNLWGGPSENRGVGLWDNGDQNNKVTFTDASAIDEVAKFSLIPYPQELVEGEGTLFVTALDAIAYGSDKMKAHAEAFAAQLKTSAGITLAVRKAGATVETGAIWFGTDEALPRDGTRRSKSSLFRHRVWVYSSSMKFLYGCFFFFCRWLTRTLIEPTQNALRFEYGFAYQSKPSESLFSSGECRYIHLR